jgi:hypothetical protein
MTNPVFDGLAESLKRAVTVSTTDLSGASRNIRSEQRRPQRGRPTP